MLPPSKTPSIRSPGLELSGGAPWAVVAVDLDPIDCHLAGYGIADAPRCDVIYRRAIPRLLDLFDELRIKGVFFVVARDARSQSALLREMHERGHEIASHSLTHPQPFRGLDDAALARETATSRAVLAECVGAPVLGFRAPAWDVDPRVLRAVAAAGYRYDASVFPSPALALGRLVADWRGAAGGPIAQMKSCYAWAPRHPHIVGRNGNSLIEFPIAVTPRLRLPAYHTISHLIPSALFDRILGSALRAPQPVCYELHAADALDLSEDRLDPRISVHPGMQIPIAAKLAALRRILHRIARERRMVTYRQMIEPSLLEERP
ncbi:MAG TPA: polysaccharide deacetylase family protein [Terriglobales bacterium]|nr:polysaccharide deacetylase family protein [Terriglobales bacterium]